MSNALHVTESADVMIIRFSRPEIRSPLSVSVLTELECLVRKMPSREDLKALIFTGTDNVFASGADLREIAAVPADDAPGFARRGQHLMSAIAGIPQMTIAAVNGYCFGGALDLALSCDYRIAAPNATFAHPGAGLGIITGWGGTQRLPRLIGTARALEMFFSAAQVNATRGLHFGLIDEIDNDPLARALAFVSGL